MLRKKQCVRLALCCLLLGTVCSFACRKSSSSSAASQRPNTTAVGKETEYRDASDTFFEHPSIPKIFLKVSLDQEAKLNENARQYVKCTLIDNGAKEFIEVGLKLKGAAGSFQDLSGKPAFTINVSKFHKKQTFHELEKFHLNNSVQDELYTNEWLCSSICRDAGLPAPRVSHARVWFNDRDLGLYVLKEGFDRRFLNRHFSDPTGNLYDGGFCQDIDVDLEKDSGDGCSDNSDIHALKEACCESEPKLRTGKLMQHLNVNAFQTFMAIEMMCCHWDGYVSNRNNYRIYFSSNTNRAHFFPHGMDQMFQDPGFQTFGIHPPW